MRLIVLLTCLFFAGREECCAAPNIASVAGVISHGEVVVIHGSGFGQKNPPAPLLWDDGTSSPPLGERYDGWLPRASQQGSYFNMAYRALPFRNVSGPHARISYALGGAHAQNNADSASGSANVGIGKNVTSHKYFLNYYYRIDPLFDEENNPTATDNMKEISLTNTPGEFYPDGWGAFGYAAWCNDPGKDVPDVNYRGPVVLARIPIDPAHQSLPYSCGGNNLVYHASPVAGWVKMQWEGSYNSQYDSPQLALTTYPDNKKTILSHYGDGLTVLEWSRGPWYGFPKQNDLRFIGLGGFARVPRMNNGTNSFRYFAGVYIDGTPARIVLGDNANYDLCTVMEPQIPIAWSENLLEYKVNLGVLPDSGLAFLFVLDANGVRNSSGYPVSIGAMLPRDGAPSPPRNLRTNSPQ